MRKNKQAIRQAQREIVRQKIQLEKQKLEHENQLKTAAFRFLNHLGEMNTQLLTMISMTSQQSMTKALVE